MKELRKWEFKYLLPHVLTVRELFKKAKKVIKTEEKMGEIE